MQIGSGFSAMSGSQIALRLLKADDMAPSLGAKAPIAQTAQGDINALLAYAKKANAVAAKSPPQEPIYDPAADLPEGWSMGELVSVDTLDPAYREFAKNLGATHVRLYGPDPVSDAVFEQKVSAYLDETYGEDATFVSAKAAGQVSIMRQSDVLTALGDTQFGEQAMTFFRGTNGSEYFGSGATGKGAPSQALDAWTAGQTAAGRVIANGGFMGLSYVASWAQT